MRKPMVTRTFLTTKAIVMVANTEIGEVENMVVTLPRTYKDDKKRDKAIKEMVDTDTIKYVATVSAEAIETLYGMSEEDFLASAVELDKESRKPVETSADEESADAE